MSDDDAKHTTPSGLRKRGEAPHGVEVNPPADEGPRYGPGDVIAGRYRLGRKLGEGGMGEVWLAHNETLEIDVAVKLIRRDLSSPEMADRLLTEARAAARLGHPAIVRVNDFGKTERGEPFIVMELLDGEDLATALQKRGRLSAVKAVRTLLPIAHALTTAHTKGIVHRDLKPENVFLARDDDGATHPKLVDFGVAKLEKVLPGRQTDEGALLGSPLYMSPEQARGDDVDHRADIWAFGVVLYETITGRPPFEGKNYNAVLYSIIANPPTPIADLAVGDADLWGILERALQKDPDRRYYSIRDLGEALARWLLDHDVQDDVGGASLQTTWLQWRRDEDALVGGPSVPPPPGSSSGPLPPIPAAPALPREREITQRRGRATTVLPWVILGV
ncbi:MAG: serine/threonine protein kinase, partial [Deltaproteobacteria bacterium]|nr:serine/threonine protein kinase [Deltaproteobacteria bacterium]